MVVAFVHTTVLIYIYVKKVAFHFIFTDDKLLFFGEIIECFFFSKETLNWSKLTVIKTFIFQINAAQY